MDDSARDLTHIPQTAFCLLSQPKQGHETEQGTAAPAVLSPLRGIALQALTPQLQTLIKPFPASTPVPQLQ